MKFILLLLLSTTAFAQQYQVSVPKDPTNTPIFGGLGAPIFDQPVVNVTTYGAVFTTLDQSGLNLGRNYRSLYVNNPSAAIGIRFCLGDNSGCATDHMRVPPDSVIILDNLLMGQNNNVTRIYWKLDSAGSVTPDVGAW